MIRIIGLDICIYLSKTVDYLSLIHTDNDVNLAYKTTLSRIIEFGGTKDLRNRTAFSIIEFSPIQQ